MSNLEHEVSLTASLQVGIEHLLHHVRSDKVVGRVPVQAVQGTFGVCAVQGTFGVCAQKTAMLMKHDLSHIITVKN
jgi:sulfopyruvate decarboxylase TPP-binding subunit